MNGVLTLLLVLVFLNGCFIKDTFAQSRIPASNKHRNASVPLRPKIVKIGSILSCESMIGKVGKIALEAAVEDVNSDPTVLNGTKLQLTIHDSNSSSSMTIVDALQFVESESVALIGPESSVLAHMISYIMKDHQIPLLSFTATDPTLSSLQYPFFVRTTHSDLFQMAAIADIIEYYEWRQVIAIYIDDDLGRNGISSLADRLASNKRSKISQKAPINPDATRDDIRNVLLQVSFMESRVLVVHTNAKSGLEILDLAHDLGMMESGYVWITTDWLSTIIDITSPLPKKTISAMQGVLTLRSHIKDSKLKRNFITKWKNSTTLGMNTYSLYAYDTIWLLARALDSFFNQGGNISFSKAPKTKDSNAKFLNLDSSTVFNGGKTFLENILQVKTNATTGQIEFTSDKNLVFPAFEVINMIGTGFRKVGYWSNSSRLSTYPPEKVNTNKSNSSDEVLRSVIWPGETVQKPRGWVFPKNGKELKIGVPTRVSFQDFVEEVKGTDMYVGYSVDVFMAAVNLLPYAVPYKIYSYGDGLNNPSYTDLVSLVNKGVYDGAVGDIAIITNRTQMADFTQPFIESGLVVVAPVRTLSSGTWAFLRPFTAELWCVIGIFFIVVGAVVWILEHRKNDEFRGTPKQVVTTLWFSFSTLFFSHKQNTTSTLGRIVLTLWLFVVLIFSSSYTASLTSILTVQKLSSSIEGINSLKSTKDRVGYQDNSFVRNYLVEEIGISETRLVPLNLPQDYEKALTEGPENGGVVAVVDERPYIELFLATRCQFSIVGQEFTKTGWGFAFPHDSPLAIDISNAILKLAETGELQRIHDKWLVKSACSSQESKFSVDRLELKRFKGLFLICGLACFLALFVYIVLILHQYTKRKPDPSDSPGSSRPGRIQSFISFIDEKEESVDSRSKKRLRGTSSVRSIGDEVSMNGYRSPPKESSSNTPEWSTHGD